MPVAEISKVASEVSKEAAKDVAKEAKKMMKELDKPLNASETSEISIGEKDLGSSMKELDKPLNEVKTEDAPKKNIEKVDKMEPQITIEFKCPEGMDKKEFTRQLKAQERGLNSQTVAQNMDNRAAFNKRKLETGEGRDVKEGSKAQDIARQKATQSRIESNQKKGMSYSEAKAEAAEWIKKQAALHNPDQIAGGDPTKVSRMGDASVNSSIGSQWRTRVDKLTKNVDDYAKGKTREELENTKMNVKLVTV